MKLALRVLEVFINAVLIAVVLTDLALSAASFTGTLRVSRELTGSMLPTIPVGSLIVYRPEPAGAVRVGQVIRLRRNDYPDPITHRVVIATHTNGITTLRTRGDANNTDDPGSYLLSAATTVWYTTSSLPPVLGAVAQAVTDHGLTFTLGLVPLAVLLPWIRSRIVSPGGIDGASSSAPDRQTAEGSSRGSG